jgi:ceramide glucosyltransferase
MLVGYVLLSVAAVGLVTCTGFFSLLLVASSRFRRRRVPEISAERFPPVTLLKPLCGSEPNLRANIASFFDQEYPVFEIVFGARSLDDPALSVVEEVRKDYPFVPVKVVISGEPAAANAKICSLQNMYAVARYDYLVISDSDVQVKPNYIREVVADLLDPEVGMTTCLYRGATSGGLWSRLEALGMSVEMTSGVLVSDLLEGMQFALGPTMAIRRDVLKAVGGFGPLAAYCADDYVLGQRVAESGKRVVLSKHVIDHVVVNRSVTASLLHQIRWMKSTRFSRPVGHAASVLSFAMPFGVLGLVAALAIGRPMLGVALLVIAALNRVLMALVAGWAVAGDVYAMRLCWLYPLRDLMGFGFWVCSFFGNVITWRGQEYRLELNGLMVPVSAARMNSGGIRYDEPVLPKRVKPSLAAERVS